MKNFDRRLSGKLIVLSKSMAKEWTCDKPWACISIDDFDEWPKINKVQQIALIQLSFADIDEPVKGSPEFLLFNRDHANQIWDFVDKHWDGIEILMVHCYAGIGRSAAVAAAIEKVVQKTDNKWYWDEYCPNALVYSTMLGVAHERGMI